MCVLLILITNITDAQINTAGIGLGTQYAKRYTQRHISTDHVIVDGIITPVHTYDNVEVNSFGGGISFHGNISFIGWLINNAWNDLAKGFYIGDYIEAAGGFGPFQVKKEGAASSTSMMLYASFGFGFQVGYKIPSLPDLASLEFRWYFNGTFNNIRADKISYMREIQDDFLNVGLTGRYGSYSLRLDYGYRHYKAHQVDWNNNAKRFSLGCYWLIDRSKKYSPGSFNAALGLRYEGFYNYAFNVYESTLNGRNHAVSVELVVMKF
ncbi:MAG: hypothetical protein ACK417_04950 [Bacteroidia bacterium]